MRKPPAGALVITGISALAGVGLLLALRRTASAAAQQQDPAPLPESDPANSRSNEPSVGRPSGSVPSAARPPLPPSDPAQPGNRKPNAGPQSTTTPPPAPAPQPKPEPAKPGSSEPKPGPPQGWSQNPVVVTQKTITDAVWAALQTGDTNGLEGMARAVATMTPAFRAYLMAAIRDGASSYKELGQWQADFNRDQARVMANLSAEQQKTESIVASTVSAAAAIANVIPAVGQVISVALTASLAIRHAILAAFPLPPRVASDQVHEGVEGLDYFFGFRPKPDDSGPNTLRQDRFLAVKQDVVQDPVAFSLPVVEYKTVFHFAPSLAAFQAAATELGLY